MVTGWRPEWLAFTSKNVAHEAARALGRRGRPGLGAHDWEVGGAQVFVLPGTSGANQRRDYDGRPHRLAWWQDLASLVGR
jgi:TDG/mug DNA glycosylase family protein